MKGRTKQALNMFGGQDPWHSLCVCTDKNYATSNISVHIKGLLEELPWSSEAGGPVLPACVLNHAFICLPIETDAKCP